MKFITAALALHFLVTATHAECDGEELCISPDKPCTGKEDDCCTSTGCFGYPFFKKCQPPPICLPEWYDCSGAIGCCGMLVCAENDNGSMTCQEEEIDTRTVPTPEDPTNPPTAAPEPPNLEITKVPGPVTYHDAAMTGDPHITTFDGVRWDCMGNGEHVILKSLVTRRQIQGRFIQLSNKKWSAMRGIVIQDEGDTPKVQISVPVVREGVFHHFGRKDADCIVQFFVDGVQRDIYNGSGSDKVAVTVSNNGEIFIKYTESEMKVKINFSYWNGCLMNAYFDVPDNDEIVGILGSPDGVAENDWMKPDGTVLPLPPADKRGKGFEPFMYCQENWCIRNEEQSIFTYNQVGVDFEDFEMCDLPHNAFTRDHILSQVTQEIEDLCGIDFECKTDAVMGSIEVARIAKNMRDAGDQTTTCRQRGGDCNVAQCCAGYTCASSTEFTGKVCFLDGEEQSTCHPEADRCDNSSDSCCEGLLCTEHAAGLSFCSPPPPACVEEQFECEATSECCGEAECVGPDGDKECLILPKENGVSVLPNGNECYEGGLNCLTGSFCMNGVCAPHPTCWAKAGRNCNPAEGMPGCCAGFACLPHSGNGRMLCSALPECAIAEWGSCEHVGCCDVDENGNSVTTECKDFPYEVDGATVIKKRCEITAKN